MKSDARQGPPQIAQRSFRVVLETPKGLRSFDCQEDEYVWNTAARHDILKSHSGRWGK